MTVTAISPSLVALDPTLAAFFAPEASRSFSSHSRASGTERCEAASASRALEREIGFCFRSSAIRLMGTLMGLLLLLSRTEVVENVFAVPVGRSDVGRIDASDDLRKRLEADMLYKVGGCDGNDADTMDDDDDVHQTFFQLSWLASRSVSQ